MNREVKGIVIRNQRNSDSRDSRETAATKRRPRDIVLSHLRQKRHASCRSMNINQIWRNATLYRYHVDGTAMPKGQDIQRLRIVWLERNLFPLWRDSIPKIETEESVRKFEAEYNILG